MNINRFLENMKIFKNLVLIVFISTLIATILIPRITFAADLEKLKGEKIKLTNEQNAILYELNIIREEIDKIKHELLSLESNIDILENQIKNLKLNISEIEIKLKTIIKNLNEKAIEFYKRKNNSFLQAVISSKDFVTFFKNVNLFSYMIKRDSESVNNYIETKEELIKTKLKLEKSHEELSSYRDQYNSTHNSLLIKETEYEKKLEEIKIQVAKLENSLKEIEERIKKVQSQYPNLNIVDEYRVLATGYCPCPICCGKYSSGYTAIGLKAGYGIIAVDPGFIPLRTKILIPGYGVAIAGDTGRKIRNNHIDIGFDDHSDAVRYGVRFIYIYKIGN